MEDSFILQKLYVNSSLISYESVSSSSSPTSGNTAEQLNLKKLSTGMLAFYAALRAIGFLLSAKVHKSEKFFDEFYPNNYNIIFAINFEVSVSLFMLDLHTNAIVVSLDIFLYKLRFYLYFSYLILFLMYLLGLEYQQKQVDMLFRDYK